MKLDPDLTCYEEIEKCFSPVKVFIGKHSCFTIMLDYIRAVCKREEKICKGGFSWFQVFGRKLFAHSSSRFDC